MKTAIPAEMVELFGLFSAKTENRVYQMTHIKEDHTQQIYSTVVPFFL